MAIAEVFTYSPRPGGIEQFLGLAKRADKILRALGATTRTLTSVAGGPAPNGFLYIVETPNWKAYGSLAQSSKLTLTGASFLAISPRMTNPRWTWFHRRSMRRSRSVEQI